MFNISDLKRKVPKVDYLGISLGISEITEYSKNYILIKLPEVVENRGWDTAARLVREGIYTTKYGMASTKLDMNLNAEPVELFYDPKLQEIYFTSEFMGKTFRHEIREDM